MTFRLSSSDFGHGEPIPRKYTRDGADISPPLEWREIPEGTRSFALILEDIDAPGRTPGHTWVHWVLFNIPGDKCGLLDAIQPLAEFTDGSKHGKNSWGKLGYEGPRPPSGKHRYFFMLYGLDTALNLVSGIDVEQLLRTMKEHIIGLAGLMGTYER